MFPLIKKILIPSLVLIHSYSFSQKVYRWYQDGKVVFQTKVNTNVSFPETNQRSRNSIDYTQVDFLSKLSEEFKIKGFRQLHPELKNDPLLFRTYQIEFDEIYKVEQLIEKIATLPFIEYAEKKELHELQFTPNDLGPQSGSGNQWGLWKINAQLAWDISQGSSEIIVAVTDNAINNHPDLANQLVFPRDVVDDDDDPSACGTNDGLHGTHVSGIVGARTNNSLGVASIGFNVKVMPIKIGDCEGQLVGAYDGIVWAANNGAHIINMSWGGGGFSNYGQNVCNNAWNAGSILVAAAGNSGNDGNPIFYPAAYNNVVAVANTTTSDAKNSSSQYGTWVDISAPGTSIRSCNATTGYTSLTGTSMASPMVAGLLGLMKSHTPAMPNTQLINCMLSSADNIDAQNTSFIGQIGSGRINAYQAMLCISSSALDRDIAVSQIISPNGTSCNNTILPEVSVVNYGGGIINSFIINYQIDNLPLSEFEWSGTLLPGNTVNIVLPPVFVSNGIHSISAFTTNPNNDNDQNTNNDMTSRSFGIFATGLSLPFSETFEPSSTTTGLWNVDNTDEGITWQITNTTGTTPGTTSMGLNFFNYNTIGQRDGLLSPPLDFSTVSSASLTFNHAYRRYNTSGTDSLVIYVSTNCGQSFTRIFQRGENGTGVFATTSTSTSNFVPQQASDWCIAGTIGSACYTINLNQFAGQPNVILKFEGYNNYGNNLYLDNINVSGTPNNNPPSAAFSTSSNIGCTEQEIVFIDESIGGATSWEWQFPGGNPSSSALQNPTVIYSQPGNYQVSLTVFNNNGSSTLSSTFNFFQSPQTPEIIQTGNVLSAVIPPQHSVQWFFNGQAINNATSASLDINNEGYYSVVITNLNNCNASAGIYFGFVTNTQNVELEKQMLVYPNPANHTVNIILPEHGEMVSQQIEVINCIGQKIYQYQTSAETNENNIQLSVEHWSEGVYFVRHTYANTYRVGKLVIKK